MGPSLGRLLLAGAELGVVARCDPSWGSGVLPSGGGTGGELIATARDLGCQNRRPSGTYSPSVSEGASPVQHRRPFGSPPRDLRKPGRPANYSGKPKKCFACMIFFFFFENETDSAGGDSAG